MKAQDSISKLIEGNKRFVAAAAGDGSAASNLQTHKTILQQKPFAIILGCSDSRVPAEIVFDQGLGDLFVVRVAGNVVTPSQIGSVEFACQKFGTQLVVVLGHSRCGAIQATIDTLLGDSDKMSINLAAIVDRIVPAVSPVVTGNEGENVEHLLHQATRANVEHSVEMLQTRSQIIRALVKGNKLTIVGAEYSIETGQVEFYS